MDEVDIFYSNKRSTLKQSLIDTQRLREFRKNSKIKFIQENFKLLENKFVYSTKNLINKQYKFENNEQFIENDFGTLLAPAYEKPYKSIELQFDGDIVNCTLTKIGFIGLMKDSQNNQIIDLKNKKCIKVENDTILHMNQTFDGNLCYLTIVNNSCYGNIINLDTFKTIKTNLIENFTTKKRNYPVALISICQDEIILFNIEMKEVRFFDKNGTLIKKLTDLQSIKCLQDQSGLRLQLYDDCCAFFTDHIAEFYSYKEHHKKFSTMIEVSENRHPSIYKDIINRLMNGNSILVYGINSLALINLENKSAHKLNAREYFGDMHVISYQMTSDEVTFCLRDNTDHGKISIYHYPKLAQ